jgi:hypothetical protein
VADRCEQFNEPSGLITFSEFLERLSKSVVTSKFVKLLVTWS